jgi:hypothetical protein
MVDTSSGLTKNNVALKDKEHIEQINGKFNNIGRLIKVNKNISLQQFLTTRMSEAEIQGLLGSAQASL